jgi:hypothetical protein
MAVSAVNVAASNAVIKRKIMGANTVPHANCDDGSLEYITEFAHG